MSHIVEFTLVNCISCSVNSNTNLQNKFDYKLTSSWEDSTLKFTHQIKHTFIIFTKNLV